MRHEKKFGGFLEMLLVSNRWVSLYPKNLRLVDRKEFGHFYAKFAWFMHFWLGFMIPSRLISLK